MTCIICAGKGGWSRATGMPSRWIPSRILCLVCGGSGRWPWATPGSPGNEPPAPA